MTNLFNPDMPHEALPWTFHLNDEAFRALTLSMKYTKLPPTATFNKAIACAKLQVTSLVFGVQDMHSREFTALSVHDFNHGGKATETVVVNLATENVEALSWVEEDFPDKQNTRDVALRTALQLWCRIVTLQDNNHLVAIKESKWRRKRLQILH